MTFLNFPTDTLEQKKESVGRIMPHTEVSPTPGFLDPTSHRRLYPSLLQSFPWACLGTFSWALRPEGKS